MTRVDALLQELSARHRHHDARFLSAVRPLVESMLDPAIAADRRVGLLELLAETFERDLAIRRDTALARQHLQQYLAQLRELLGLE